MEKARQLGQSLAMDKAHKLDADHLTGILLLSPECTTLYHKTDVQKGRGAYDVSTLHRAGGGRRGRGVKAVVCTCSPNPVRAL